MYLISARRNTAKELEVRGARRILAPPGWRPSLVTSAR
jgi:hypothetical protein